jgi:two-component system, LuxR family, response regulator FixJ
VDRSEGISECLLFTGEGEGTVDTLVSVLGERGIRVTWSTVLKTCFDLLATHRWQLLVLDGDEADSNVLDVLARCRRGYPDIPVLVLVEHGDMGAAVEVMKAGAADCLQKPVDGTRLLAAVTALERRMSLDVLNAAHLTPTERTVLGHVLEGHTNQQIADALCRSCRTIEVHRRHVMKKLGATNLVDLVKRLMQTADETHQFVHQDDRLR